MDTIKPCAACSGVEMRRCNASVLCGSLAQVVYVPVPLFQPEVCQKNCAMCQSRKEDISEVEEIEEELQDLHSPSFLDETPLTDERLFKRTRMKPDVICCPFHSGGCSHAPRPEANNNLYGLTFCSGGHFVGRTGSHGLMLCPKVLPTCCTHATNIHHGRTQSTQERDIASTPDDKYEIREKSEKEPSFDSAINPRRRRLSDDSGRITWSDSGDSVLSEIQGVDSLQRTSTTTPKTCVTTSQSQFSPTPTIQTVTPPVSRSAYAEAEKLAQSSRTDRSMPTVSPIQIRRKNAIVAPKYRHHSVVSRMTRIELEPRIRHPSAWEPPLSPASHELSTVFKRSTSSPISHAVAKGIAPFKQHFPRERIQSNSPIPRRSHSDWALRRAARATTKPGRTTLDCLEEDNLHPLSEGHMPQRPRSRSLFITSNMGEMGSFMPTSRYSRHRMTLQNQISEVDFTAWTELLDAWEIGGDSPGKESINCYGVTAVPHLGGFAVTDSDKVKIKIYGTDGDMKIAFGTPTWPRYGRGIALTRDGKHVAVCHLSEVCNYTLDGVVVDRFAHEEFTSCWGIASNSSGNFVITDPKSSSVFIMTPNGEITKQIGGNTRIASRKQSKSRSSVGWMKSKSHKSLSKSPLKKNRERTDSIRRLSNVSLPVRVTMRKSSCNSDEGKKQVRLLAPRYVALNSKNQILVTDTKQRCLLLFEEDGTLVFSIGGGKMGCEKCNDSRADKDESLAQMITTREFWPVTPTPVRSASQEEKARKQSIMLSSQPVKSQSANFLSEICGSKSGCIGRNDRVKAVGAMYRGQIGRNESVDSEAYQAISLCPIRADSRNVSQFSPSHNVGNRLYDHTVQPSEPCSSYLEITEAVSPEKHSDSSKSKLKQIAKNLKKPVWLRRKNRKKSTNLPPSQVGKCESLTSLSVFEETMTESRAQGRRLSQCIEAVSLSSMATAAKQSAPESKFITFTCGSEKGRSEPTSPEDDSFSEIEPVYFRSVEHLENDSDGVTSYGSCPDVIPEPDSEEDEEVKACRRCHVEDPRGVCVDKYDNILLVDRARHRVTVFTPQGHFVRHILTKDDGLDEPMTVCILSYGSLAVTDSSPSVKIFRFAQEY